MNINNYPNDQDGEVDTSIVLCENVDLKIYNESYPIEKDEVTKMLSSLGANEGGGHVIENKPFTRSDIVLVDIADTWPVKKRTELFTPMKMNDCVLHETESQSLHSGDSRCHYYNIQDDHQIKIKSVSITVVFSGVFDGPTYIPGNLYVEFRRLSKNGQRPPVLMGSSQSINTMSEIGRIIIQYDVTQRVVDGGLFEVCLIAGTTVSYSLVLSGSFACPLLTELKREMARFIAQRDEIIDYKKQSVLSEKNLVLLERKRAIENQLSQEARNSCGRIEAELEALDLELDRQDELEDAGASIIQQINGLKLEHEVSRRLLSLRSKVSESLSSELTLSAEERGRLRQQVETLTDENKDREALLLTSTTSLWGEHISTQIINRIINQLHADPILK